MAYQFATYEKKGRLAVVTINRPEEGPRAFAEKRKPSWKAR